MLQTLLCVFYQIDLLEKKKLWVAYQSARDEALKLKERLREVQRAHDQAKDKHAPLMKEVHILRFV